MTRYEYGDRRSIPVKGLFMCVMAALLVAVAIPNDAAADCIEKTSLSATPDGEAVAASGFAYLRSREEGSQQTFILQVDVEVPDGTQLQVFADGEPAGTITVASGTGTMALNSPLPAALAQVCEIGRIWVTNAEGTTTLIDGIF